MVRGMPIWTAEIQVTPDLARRLIRAQFPQLAAGDVRPLATGWDNTVVLVDGRWVFRFPHRAVAVANLEREIAVLPHLTDASRPLPLAIPRHEFVGRPDNDFPWLFAGGPLLAGREPADIEVAGEARIALGSSLGTFLRALHASPALAEVSSLLDDDPMGRADMARRVPLARQQLVDAGDEGIWTAPPSVWTILDAATGLSRPEPTAVVHGDLHHRHLLLDDDGAPTAIIDWGDVCRGDPAVDLPLYWSFLTPPGREAFQATYGPVSKERLLRARVLALGLAATLALYARREGMRALERESVAGLERAIVD